LYNYKTHARAHTHMYLTNYNKIR